MLPIDDLLKEAIRLGASDLHLTVGLAPQLRIDGILIPLSQAPLMDEETQRLAYQMLDESRRKRFEETMELDTSYAIKGLSRFRVNLYRQRGSVACAIRVIPFEVPSLEKLGLPIILRDFVGRPSGLLLVSGPTGSGKSTTLAALIEEINQNRNCHILSIEDPIEYLHRHKKATINQRELGTDTGSFHEALRHALRQDPNVIMIGEMRDLETMSAALTLAETGHLVLATLHTSDATHAITRIVDIFPSHQQTQIRFQLSLVLIGVVVQQLIPKKNGTGRAVACEVMAVLPSVASLIRENQLHQIRSLLQTGRQHGMCTMTHAVAELVNKGEISWEEATRRTSDLAELSQLVSPSAHR